MGNGTKQEERRAASRYDARFWLACVIAALLFFGLGVQYASYQAGLAAELPESAAIRGVADFAAYRADGELVVLLEGAVARRGYYLIEDELSLRELIEYARPTKDADISRLDFAHEPVHGDAYYIGSSGEDGTDLEREWLVNSYLPAEPEVPHVNVVNLNTATAEELATLPGVGEVKARAIVDYRVEHQGFRRKEELLAVKGIGGKTYEKLADMIDV